MAETKDKKIIHELIKRYVGELRKRKFNIVGAYLFGSCVKGTAHEWSDIDVALLTDTFMGDSIDFTFQLMKVAREIDASIEPHPYLTSEFTRENPLAREVLQSGEKVI
ncbi:MAG: nucleotidyltransferase domain-containing protein [Deltaproteobacteria bacterium]|nr:nucleotidyltransferase domain-containing protein [Deltaproteobacteria bacterium]